MSIIRSPISRKRPKKIIVKLHRSGWIFIFLTIAMGFVAVNSGNNIIFLIVSMLLSFMLLSGVVAFYNLTGLETFPIKTGILTAGEESILGIEIKNRKRLPSILIELRLGEKSDIIPILPSSKNLTLWLPWTHIQRGLIPWPEFILGSSFPFGFIWRGETRKIHQSLVVSPSQRPHEISFLFEKKDGESSKKGKEGHGEWFGIRPHRPGEGPGNVIWKKIDWHLRSLQSFPQPYPAHQFASDKETPILMDWFDPDLAHLETEERLRVLRYLLEMAVSFGRAWSLQMPEESCNGFAQQGKEKALRLLALHEPLPPKTVTDAKKNK